MTTPKSAEEIIAMWPYKMSDAEMFCLRIALASHTAYLLGKMPQIEPVFNSYGRNTNIDAINANADCREILERAMSEI